MIVRSTRVVLPDGVLPASIEIEDGRISAIGRVPTGSDVADFGDLLVSPGIVDTHIHINEPGRTEWEGFDTATRAAAAGGVTTVVDMPLNSIPPTTTVAALEAKRAAARAHCHVDVAFWGGVVPGNSSQLEALAKAGVRGFKCFLVPSGVDEFPAIGEQDLRDAMPIVARTGLPLLVHAELPQYLQPSGDVGDAASYAKYLATRPAVAEAAAIRLVADLAGEFGVHVHIVHVSCAEGVDAIAKAKAGGIAITGETCPHYLTFAAEEIPDGATEFKCAPPIRQVHHRDALKRALESGVLDLVATDHSPAPPPLKCRGDFMRAWGGIASLELSLAATWTVVARAFRADDRAAESRALQNLARWLSGAPAQLAGLGRRKGRIAVGFDADLVIWNPYAVTTVDPSKLQQRHKVTPYAGRPLRGVVHATLVRGQRVWTQGDLVAVDRGHLV